jgi:hypothetical protein
VVMVIDTHSPNSPISSDRCLAVYPSSWMHFSISAAVNGVLMMGLPVGSLNSDLSPEL